MTKPPPEPERWEDYFVPGERLIWQGVPMVSPWFGVPTLLMAAFGMPFLLVGLGISGAGLLGVLGLDFGMDQSLGSFFMIFFGVPFFAAGAGLVFGPAYAAIKAPEKVRYALSDQRAYIATTWWNRKLEVLTVDKDAPITLEGDRSVLFQTIVSTDSDGDRRTDKKGFNNIADAREVYHLLRAIQAGHPPDRVT